MPSSNVLDEHFSRLLQSLNAEGIPYLIIGGYAVIVHGYVRATKDLDIWIEADERYAEALGRALWTIGVRAPPVELMRNLRESAGLRLGGEDTRIDLLFRVAGVDFAPSYARRVEVEVDGVALPFIGLADLRASKRAAGRLQDLADLENLPLE
ncbi:MAG: nucleotidyltransferase [Caldilineaceae bacterium]|nr:nucleotidyltransferase [Caldilineaceae bacterium]